VISTWHSKGNPKLANSHQLDYVDEGLLGLTSSEFFCVHWTRKYIQNNCEVMLYLSWIVFGRFCLGR